MDDQAPTTFSQEETPAVEVPVVNRFPQTPNKGGSKRTFAVVLMALSLVLIIGGIIYFLGQNKPGLTEASPIPEALLGEMVETTPTPVPTVSSTPKAADREVVKFQVLNGTGIAKEGSFLESALKKLGYAKFTVGNADKQDYTETEVTYASTLAAGIQAEITTELERIYTKVKVLKSPTLTFDVKIITGLRKGSTAKPSATPTATSTATPKATTTASPTATPTPTPTATTQ